MTNPPSEPGTVADVAHDRTIPFARPLLGEEERQAAAAVLDGHILTHGPQVAAFEAAFAKRLGVRHAVALSSCTAGLHLALVAKGIGPGDDVVVPAMTHVATAHAVEHCGARVVFADVEAETGCLDPEAVAKAVTSRTRAIIPVHYLGLPCDMDRLSAIADEADAALIEDAATGLGALWKDRPAGTIGTCGVFSFYPTKHMTTLEGGMLITNDDTLSATVRKQRAFGYDKTLGERTLPGLYDIDTLGWNYRMNEVQAAIGLHQLDRLDGFLASRATNAKLLAERLGDLPGARLFPFVHGARRSGHFCVNVTLDPNSAIRREDLMAHLQSRGVGFSVHYPIALPASRYYAERLDRNSGAFPATHWPVANWIAQRTLSLPCGPHLVEGDVETIAWAVREFFGKE
ncbi:MAG: DegT/DnrJ/EryC1/StrS family aminotransferase [Rhodospirillum sp.]|nr:DegT/DnrJ/EryC1/StrS family aminotransferase [Rhodospirillum sp.]MCF8490785.1 DegT/DnrJ/EryC1/StrS family aminotransferase [Rhodospirillum sp.]MCF8499846.1 DegT/DnrJ/EryC1/StrS family aminotransferase [Rhodospirillum sp.]